MVIPNCRIIDPLKQNQDEIYILWKDGPRPDNNRWIANYSFLLKKKKGKNKYLYPNLARYINIKIKQS